MGFKVFPLDPGQKHPLGAKGKSSPYEDDSRRPVNGAGDATTDVAQIHIWWTIWPDANIGICAPSGMIIVDIDPRNGGARTKAMKPTLESKSGRGGGGGHLFYRKAPEGLNGKLAPGIDLITAKKYVVAPPSIHPDTGCPYEWVGEFDIARIRSWPKALVPAPDKPAAPKSNAPVPRPRLRGVLSV